MLRVQQIVSGDVVKSFCLVMNHNDAQATTATATGSTTNKQQQCGHKIYRLDQKHFFLHLFLFYALAVKRQGLGSEMWEGLNFDNDSQVFQMNCFFFWLAAIWGVCKCVSVFLTPFLIVEATPCNSFHPMRLVKMSGVKIFVVKLRNVINAKSRRAMHWHQLNVTCKCFANNWKIYIFSERKTVCL